MENKDEKSKTVIFEKEGRIATVMINRPDFLNALNRDVWEEFEEVLRKIKGDDEIGVIIVTGVGEKAFVAGADVNEFVEMSKQEWLEFLKKGKQILYNLENLEKPVIAAVNGFAMGGGCELALACHIRIASENAVFGLPEVGLGLIPGAGGTQRLPRAVGKAKATEVILTGSSVNAQEALRIGLVNQVVPISELRKTCKKMAEKILSKAPLSVKYALGSIHNVDKVNLKEGLDLETEALIKSYSTKDRVEGVRAFIEKRKPVFKGE